MEHLLEMHPMATGRYEWRGHHMDELGNGDHRSPRSSIPESHVKNFLEIETVVGLP
jgi:hypothetical protein